MSDKSSIEWTDATWNPIRGTKGRHHCVRISEGCKNCYAATMNHRFKGPDYVKGADTPRLDEKALLEPLKRKRPRRIFVCSMTDLFMDEHTDEMIDKVFAVMALAPHHTFQVLTKRAKRMARYVRNTQTSMIGEAAVRLMGGRRADDAFARNFEWEFPDEPPALKRWPLPNVWLGVSAENQRADERIPDLLATPAAVRFVSAEPLLGPINFAALPRPFEFHKSPNGWLPWLAKNLHWVIVGGESGPRTRQFDADWSRNILNTCLPAGIPVFVKQMGSGWSRHTDLGRGRHISDSAAADFIVRDSKGGDPSEWPSDLRVREFPGAVR